MAGHSAQGVVRVSRKPKTASETEIVRLITATNESTPIGNFSQLVKDLAAAGIVIGTNEVVIKGDKVKVLNGNDVAVMFEGGKLNAKLIDAETIVVDGIQGNTLDAKDATISNLNVENVKLTGSFRSPFVPVGAGYEKKFADNISLVTRSGTLNLHIKSTGLDQVGRVIHLTHFRWNNKNADFGNVYVDVPEGFSIYENGVAFKKIRISRECVTLLGLGDDKNFFGWCVIGRCDLMTTHQYGRQKKVLAYGKVTGTIGDVSIQYRTFDGSQMSVSREDKGLNILHIPKWVDSESDLFVTLTNTSSFVSLGSIKATSNGFDINVMARGTNSFLEGCFNFEISNFNDFDYIASPID